MKTEKIIIPSSCPYCGAPLVKQLADGAHLYCSNSNCKERLLQQLNYFVTKQCMNIDGLSEKTLRKLQDANVISTWQDLYNLTYDTLINIGFGEKTSSNIITQLEKSKTEVPAENVLMALGIPMLGKVTAQKLLQDAGSILELSLYSKNKLVNLIGDVAGSSVYEYFKEHNDEIQNVCKILTYTYKSNIVTSSSKLEGKTILATGTLSNFSRESIKESIISNGGKYASGVSSKLSFMIVGENAGSSKLDKAKSLGIQLITEDEYLKLIY